MRRLALILMALTPALLVASISASSGPYTLTLSSQPAVIPVGEAHLKYKITDASGKPLDGLEVRSIARMPGMPMGEQEAQARPIVGEPGAYRMRASFPMGGAYEVVTRIKGPQGEETITIPVRPGQDLGEGAAGGFAIWSLVPWILGTLLLIWIIVRMRATGQTVNTKGILNKGTIGGILLLGAMLAVSIWAVNNLRRQGAMTPLEAQVMEMNTPAPPGTSAVEVAEVKRGRISEFVKYSGQAVGFVEQDVNPRTTGVIVWMPHYVGSKVKKGQVLARLDTSQLDPQLAERAAMTGMAAQGVGVAVTEYEMALQEIAEARAELSAKEGMVEEAQAMLIAAQHDKAAMEAEAAAMLTDVASAQAEVTAADQMAQFKSDELLRMRQLFEQKAVSRSELQMAESEAADAEAKLRQARQMVRQAESKVTAAKANVNKSNAMISAAQKKVRQAQADVRAAQAAIRARESAAAAKKRMISKEQAGVAQARAGYQSAAAQKGYSMLKAEVDGVVTERVISPGVLVNPGQTVLKVAQISPIRLQANVADADLARITPGAKARVTVQGQKIEARITTLGPSLDPQVRTGIAEAVWPNKDGKILPGQFLSMEIEVGSAEDTLYVPVEAIQTGPSTSDEPFVWVVSNGIVVRAGVQTGASDGENIEIVSGLTEGQQVVTRGGAFLKEGSAVSTAGMVKAQSKGEQIIEVSATGFSPSEVFVEQGKPAELTFVRISEQGCGTEVLFPDLGINQPLPLNKPVKVAIPAQDEPLTLNFSCGMNMLKGKVVVR